MSLNVSPDCTTYVRDAVAVLLPPLWHTLSPGYTIDGFPLGTLTFHQSGQNIETYCPDWMVMQLVLHVVFGLLGCDVGCGVGVICPLPAYVCHVFKSPYTTLRSSVPLQLLMWPVLVYCHATANGQWCRVGCADGGLNP